MVGALLLGLPAAAEMSAEDYRTGARGLSPGELAARGQAQTEADRAQAERREREREARAAAARQRLEAQRTARPAGERLVEAHCAPCHRLDTLAAHSFGYVGWWVTVLRMQWLNGATFGPGERSLMVKHLARTQPPAPLQARLEWALAGTLPCALLFGLWRFTRRRPAHRR